MTYDHLKRRTDRIFRLASMGIRTMANPIYYRSTPSAKGAKGELKRRAGENYRQKIWNLRLDTLLVSPYRRNGKIDQAYLKGQYKKRLKRKPFR